MDAITHQVVDEPRRPGRGIPGDYSFNRLAGVQRPLEGTVAQQLDERLLTVLGQQRGQNPSGRRTPLRLSESLDDRAVDDLLDVLVVEQLHHRAQRGGGLSGHPSRVPGLGEPLADPAADLRIAQLGLDDVRRHEILPNKGAEPLTELVFLARNDRGVRNLEPKGVAEQGRDREPVGQRTDHAGFGRGAQVPEPGWPPLGLAPPAGQEDHRRADQKAQRHGLHPAQVAQPLGVGLGVRAGK